MRDVAAGSRLHLQQSMAADRGLLTAADRDRAYHKPIIVQNFDFGCFIFFRLDEIGYRKFKALGAYRW